MADFILPEAGADAHPQSVDWFNSPTFPESDDWGGWVEVWCREDDGTINCVPICLRSPSLMIHVGSSGRLKNPDMIPSTPYTVARFVHGGAQIPWRGTGLHPHVVRELWETRHDEPAPTPEPEPVSEIVVAAQLDGMADLYMIRSGAGPIKIGVSSNPVQRLRGLQTAHPWRLELLCIVPGGCALEAVYHAQFAEHRLEGEWFNPAPGILAEIERLSGESIPPNAYAAPGNCMNPSHTEGAA